MTERRPRWLCGGVTRRALLRVVLAGVAAALTGCEKETPSGAPARSPRVVSFSPALTRMVYDLGLADHIVGVTRYCELPAGESRPVVGDTLNIRVEPILAVRPDIILSQTKPGAFESVVQLRPQIRIAHFEIETLADIARAMERIGQLLNEPESGRRAARDFTNRLDMIRAHHTTAPPVRTLFVMGYDAPSGPGRDTFIDEMITLAGGVNILHEQFRHWKRPSLERILEAPPQVVICQSQPDRQEAAEQYWRQLFEGKARIFVVTENDWTIPAGHLAGRTEQLAAMLKP